jgi:tRNA 2-thiocytidine biosynthesis protein TtcA
VSGEYLQRARPASDLEHLIMRRMGQAIGDHRLVEPGDRILVAISGGKDSFALLHTLDLHRRRSPFDFSLAPVFIDAGWDPGAAAAVVESFSRHGFEVEVVARDIRSNVRECLRPGTNPCALCARLRRGVLYDQAPARGCNKIALGHHLDDLIETLFLNLFFTGQVKSMAVNLLSDDGRNRVIRPLAYVESEYVAEFAAQKKFSPVEIACPYISGKTDPQRLVVRQMVERLVARFPRARRSIFAAMKHVRPSHLMDPDLEERSCPRDKSSEPEE